MNTNFFRKYPRIEYLIDDNGATTFLTDISRAVSINSMSVPDDMTVYTLYDIQDGDRPDVVSHKLYNDVQYYWTFFIINDHLKDGYNSAWPLQYNDFSQMIESEYGKYSAISFLPTASLDGAQNTDFSLVPLDDVYLPYLRLSSFDGSTWAKILRYDTALHQCVVYDIALVSNGISVSRQSFVKYPIVNPNNLNLGKTDYRIAWDDSVMIAESKDDSEQTMIARNARLKQQWLDSAFANFTSVDLIGLRDLIATEFSDSFTQAQIDAARQQLKKDYVFNKRLAAASNFFRWNRYEDAARNYTSNSKVVTAYDVLSNPNTIFHEYTSNVVYETDVNDSKRQIKVIKAEYIKQFSEEYYEVLNS